MLPTKSALPLVVLLYLVNERLLEDDLAERHGLLGKVMPLHIGEQQVSEPCVLWKSDTY